MQKENEFQSVKVQWRWFLAVFQETFLDLESSPSFTGADFRVNELLVTQGNQVEIWLPLVRENMEADGADVAELAWSVSERESFSVSSSPLADL